MHGTYGTARTLCRIVSFMGWVLVVLPFLGIVAALLGSSLGGFLGVFTLAGIPFGLALVLFGQSSRANLDSADYARQMLELMQKQSL